MSVSKSALTSTEEYRLLTRRKNVPVTLNDECYPTSDRMNYILPVNRLNCYKSLLAWLCTC